MSDTTKPQLHKVEFVVSDPSETAALLARMRQDVDAVVDIVAVPPGQGEQGGYDILTAIAGSGGLIAVIRMLPAFLRARRSGLRIETTVNGRAFVLDATNVDDVLPILERLLRE